MKRELTVSRVLATAGRGASPCRGGKTRVFFLGEETMNAEPQEFRFSIGGHFRPSYTVEGKQGEKVRYRARTSSGRETEQELTPTTRQWLEFWKAVAQIKNWKERYGNSAVCDGTSWIVEIKTEGRTFRSSGLNAYPPRFKTFLRHVKNFVGGLAFA